MIANTTRRNNWSLEKMRAEIKARQKQQKRDLELLAEPEHNPGIAAVLSFLIPGLGYLYAGKIFTGIGSLILTLIGYAFFVVPGIFLHIFFVYETHAFVKRTNQQRREAQKRRDWAEKQRNK